MTALSNSPRAISVGGAQRVCPIRADDGIRTRVNGFAGRCLATQPHPRCHPPCQSAHPPARVRITVIGSPARHPGPRLQVQLTCSAWSCGWPPVTRSSAVPARGPGESWTLRRLRPDRAHRRRTRDPRHQRGAAYPDHRRGRRGADPAGEQVRVPRCRGAGHRPGGPIAGGSPDRLGHRLFRDRDHHLPPGLGARPDHRGRGLGVGRDRDGRVAPACCSSRAP